MRRILKFFQPDQKIDFSEILWLSLGENCLPDNILHRHGLKSFSTPFSHGRSNLDYALALEKSNYEGLMLPENLKHGLSEKKKVVRSTLFNQCDNIYNDMHMKGFEMTHHDVIDSEKDRENFNRKIERQLEVRGNKKVVFLYHHRINKNSNLDLIFKKASEFSTLYSKGKYNCTVIVFAQQVITDNEERKVHYKNIRKNIHYFEFFTRQLWGGKDDDLFWARTDDDLIKKMIDTSVSLFSQGKKQKEGFI